MRGARRGYERALDARAARARVRCSAARGRCCSRSLGAASRHGQRVHPEPRRGRRRAARAAHSRARASRRRSRCRRRSSARCARCPRSRPRFAKIGTAEVATDPMPPSVADGFVMHEAARGVAGPAQAEGARSCATLEAAVARVPGNNYEFTQPIQMRFNELIAGVRSDVAVKVFGDDLDAAARDAASDRRGARARPGRGRREGRAGHRPADARGRDRPRRRSRATGSRIADVQEVVRTAIGGSVAGQIFEGDRRFDVVVRLPEALRARPRRARAAADPAARARGEPRRRARRRAARRRARSCRSAPSRSSRSARARTRSAARTASAASW